MSGGEGTNLNSKQRRVKKGRRHFTRYVHNYTWYTQFQVHSKIKNMKVFIFRSTTRPRIDPKFTKKNLPYMRILQKFYSVHVLS